MQRILQPVIWREGYGQLVERELLAYFKDAVFRPLFDVLIEAGAILNPKDQAIKFDESGKEKLNREERQNAGRSALEEALATGRVWYADGVFGSDQGFGSEVSRELRALGARYDAEKGVYKIEEASIPFQLRGALSTAQAQAEAAHRAVITTLTQIAGNMAQAPVGLDLSQPITRILIDLNSQFNKSVKGLEAITVAPELQPAVREALVKTLTQNLELSVKNFSADQVLELRKMAEANLMSGARLDKLSRMIEAQFGVAKRKANFLASQETSLLTAKFRMERAKNAGSTSYVWYCRHDNRVRPGHQALNGTRQNWDQPPVDNPRTGEHHNPGEAFNCRCFARPIIEVAMEHERRAA